MKINRMLLLAALLLVGVTFSGCAINKEPFNLVIFAEAGDSEAVVDSDMEVPKAGTIPAVGNNTEGVSETLVSQGNTQEFTFLSDSVYFGIKSQDSGTLLWVKVFFNDSDAYLFLPSHADTKSLVFKETYALPVSIDKSFALNGNIMDIGIGEHELTINDTDYLFHVLKSANVPSVFIESKEALSFLQAEKTNTISGTVHFADEDGFVTSAGLEKMNGRGNTSWNAGAYIFGKFPYNIKLEKATDVFGIAKNKKWALIANCFDESLMRNILINDLSDWSKLEYTPGSKNVDLYFNGEYLGTYQLSQRVDAGKNSLLNIFDLDKENQKVNTEPVSTSSVEVQGDTSAFAVNECFPGSYKYCEGMETPEEYQYGYLLEFELSERYGNEKCGFITDRGQPVVIKSPSDCSKEEVLFIKSYIQEVEDAIYSQDGISSNGYHYSDLIDVDSFAKVYLINEFSMNVDANATSFFVYLDKNSKLKAGPVWDYDWALGSYGWRDGMNLASGNGWYVRDKQIKGLYTYDLVSTLCSKEDFWARVKYIWKDSMSENVSKLISEVDDYYDMFFATAEMNYSRFNYISDGPSWGSSDTGSTYEENISSLKEYMKKRKAFLDNEM